MGISGEHSEQDEARSGHRPAASQYRRVRFAYDQVAVPYTEQFHDELRHKPLDRALLGAFAEQVGPTGLVLDIGCGPGHVAGYLAGLGVTVRGLDLSPEMIRIARRRLPGICFEVGELPGLGLAPGELVGAVLFYSIIHLTPEHRAAAFAELGRALAADGLMLVAFHLGDDEPVHVDNWFGQAVSFDGYLISIPTITAEITAGGLSVEAVLERSAYRAVETSGTRRCYILARRGLGGPGATGGA